MTAPLPDDVVVVKNDHDGRRERGQLVDQAAQRFLRVGYLPLQWPQDPGRTQLGEGPLQRADHVLPEPDGIVVPPVE